MLVRDQSADIDDLIGLGEELRRSSTVDGEADSPCFEKEAGRRRQVVASRAADRAAHGPAGLTSCRARPGGDPRCRLWRSRCRCLISVEGRLTTTLSYSGLGFAADGPTGPPARTRLRPNGHAEHQAPSHRLRQPWSGRLVQQKRPTRRSKEALRGSVQPRRTSNGCGRPRTVAERRATKAHEDEAAAKKRLDTLRRAFGSAERRRARWSGCRRLNFAGTWRGGGEGGRVCGESFYPVVGAGRPCAGPRSPPSWR